LTGLSITYIAALDRLIELEKLAGSADKIALYTQRRNLARDGLGQLTTEEGYFIKSLDPDGTRHGVYGAEKHGYFEASPNHDAIAFRVVNDAQARKIYSKIASIPGIRRYSVIIANEPGLDDMYDPGKSWLWKHSTWVNGGHWSTCEARMIMGYYRLGKYEDARRSMQHILTFARKFRMDNPLVEFGSKVYQPKEPINLCYDTFGPAAAMVRGLFEYLYRADGLTLVPHVPPGITRLDQRFPIRFGTKKLYISTLGRGVVSAVWVNGEVWSRFDGTSVFLPYAFTPDTAHVQIAFGDAVFDQLGPYSGEDVTSLAPPDDPALARVHSFYTRLVESGLGESYEAQHAKLVIDYAAVVSKRREMLSEGRLKPLPEPSQSAADKSYVDTVTKLRDGLETVVQSYEGSNDPHKKRVHQLWLESQRI
jgi:hypothetical protein